MREMEVSGRRRRVDGGEEGEEEGGGMPVVHILQESRPAVTAGRQEWEGR